MPRRLLTTPRALRPSWPHAPLLALALTITSCSIAGPEDDPLEVLWTVPGRSEALLGKLGGADEAHVYVSHGGPGRRTLRAHRRADGALVWSAPVGPECSPVLTDGETVACPSDRLYAYDAASGDVLWTFEPEAPLYFAEGALDAGRVFSASYEYAVGSTLYAHDVRTGDLLWKRTFEAPNWHHVEIEAVVADGDEVIVSIDAHISQFSTYGTGVLIGVDAATGTERWRYENGDGAEPDPCEASGVTVYRGPGTPPGGLIIYVNPAGNGCSEGNFIALDLQTRALVYQIAAPSNWGGSGQGPIVRDGTAYVTWNDGSAYAFDAATGETRWNARPDDATTAFGHVVCGEVVVASGVVTDVYDRRNGQRRGRLYDDDSAEYAAQLAVYDDHLYIATIRSVTAYDCR